LIRQSLLAANEGLDRVVWVNSITNKKEVHSWHETNLLHQLPQVSTSLT